MKITFELTRRELFKITLRQIFRQQPIRILYYILFVLIAYQSWKATLRVSSFSSKALMFVAMSIIPLLIIIVPFVVLSLLSAYSSKNKTLTSPITISTDEESITIETAVTHAVAKWSGLSKIDNLGDYLMLRFSEYGGTPIPKRSFSSEEDWEHFITFCEGKIQAA